MRRRTGTEKQVSSEKEVPVGAIKEKIRQILKEHSLIVGVGAGIVIGMLLMIILSGGKEPQPSQTERFIEELQTQANRMLDDIRAKNDVKVASPWEDRSEEAVRIVETLQDLKMATIKHYLVSQDFYDAEENYNEYPQLADVVPFVENPEKFRGAENYDIFLLDDHWFVGYGGEKVMLQVLRNNLKNMPSWYRLRGGNEGEVPTERYEGQDFVYVHVR